MLLFKKVQIFKMKKRKKLNKTIPSPLLSIIVPFFNNSRYVKKLLKSIYDNFPLKQNFFEVIFVNDGSDEIERSKLDKFKNEFIFTILDKKNGGVSSAKNLGMQNANGKFLWFVDSDDYITENWNTEFLEKIKFLDVDIISIEIQQIKKNELKKIPWIYDRSPEGIYNYDNLIELWLNIGNNYCYIFRNNLIKSNKIKFDENISLGEDAIFNTMCFVNAKKIYNSKCFLYVQNRNLEGSLSRPKKENFSQQFLNELQSHVKILDILKDKQIQKYFFIHSLMYSNENKLKLISTLNINNAELNQLNRLFNKIRENSPYNKFFSHILLDNLNKSLDYKRLYMGAL